ncbi:hypothetical protein AZE42_04499 [Rhizopogon vesiculosus]|uniref:Uncharacterized protein n=1 Tax=Rhizopogon vesiculosus TaxID=180088 RepID=A0A1J8QE96_9AGAM|nr:hypothetical protein AZE42_04499 [Rhizopogon vesiculosus]
MSSADAMTCLAFSPDSQKVASGTARLGVTITHIASQSRRQLAMSAVAHTPAIVAWSPDGAKIMSASLDNTLRCWDAISSDPLGPPFQGHKELILAASFLRDSSHAISLSKDGELLMWDTRSGEITRRETVSKYARTIFVAALSMDGTLLITSDRKECVAWDIPACMQIAAIALPDVPLLQAAIIPNSQVVLAFGNMSFWIWDTTTRDYDDARFEGLDRDAISCAMAVSPDGGLLVLEIDGVDDEYPTHFYDRKGHEFPKPNIRCIHPFAFSPDGKRFAASHVRSDSKDDSHKLVIRTVEEARTLTAHLIPTTDATNQIRGYKSRDVLATTAVADKGKQRSLPPGFFEQSPRGSGSAEGRVPATKRRGTGLAIPVANNVEQASSRTPGRKRRHLSKIWRRIPGPRSHKGRSTGREANLQAVPEPSTRRRRNPSLSRMWKRIRHPRSHKPRANP